MSSYMVCGYYTPNYAKWVRPLQASLDRHGQPHDFAELPQHDLGWEAATLLKPEMILIAMAKYYDRAIVWLDVDCTVHGDLSPLASMPADISLRFEIKRQKGRAMILRAHAGTLVIQPTAAARHFVEKWASWGDTATHGDDDEATLARAIVGTPGVSIAQLNPRWFAGGGRRATDPIIVHDWASQHTRKVHKLARFFHRQIGKLQTVRGYPS